MTSIHANSSNSLDSSDIVMRLVNAAFMNVISQDALHVKQDQAEVIVKYASQIGGSVN